MIIPYDQRFEAIDEQLVRLISERMQTHPGANSYPNREQLTRWGETYHVDPLLLASVFAALSEPRRPPRLPFSPQDLQRIVVVMKKTTVEGITYQMTRMEQYAECSLVYMDVYTGDDEPAAELNIQLMLEIQPDEGRTIQLHRSQSQNNQATLVYSVSPNLPDDVATVWFRLVPHPMPHRSRLPERTLDQVVAFEP